MSARSTPGGSNGDLIAFGIGAALGGFFTGTTPKGLVSSINRTGPGVYQLITAPLSISPFDFQPDITLLTVNGGQWSIQPTSLTLITLFTFDVLGAPNDIDFMYRYWRTWAR